MGFVEETLAFDEAYPEKRFNLAISYLAETGNRDQEIQDVVGLVAESTKSLTPQVRSLFWSKIPEEYLKSAYERVKLIPEIDADVYEET